MTWDSYEHCSLRNIAIYIYSLAHGRDEWVFETVDVKSWQIESSFASQVIWTLMTWGKLVDETVIARIGDATE